MMIRLVPILALFCGFAQPAFAEIDYSSGNYMLPICEALADSKGGAWEARAWEQGECSGIIETLLWVSSSMVEPNRFCHPVGITNGQSRRIVVNFLHRHPEQLHVNFKSLALDALREAWPCPNQ